MHHVANLKSRFEALPSLVFSNPKPDFIFEYASIVPCQEMYTVLISFTCTLLWDFAYKYLLNLHSTDIIIDMHVLDSIHK